MIIKIGMTKSEYAKVIQRIIEFRILQDLGFENWLTALILPLEKKIKITVEKAEE